MLLQTFEHQVGPSKELVVVDGGMTEEVRETLRNFGARVVEPLAGWVLGDLYNLAVRHARGEYVIIGDEDDWSAPVRMEAQLERLQDAGADGCILNTVTMYDLPTGRAFESFKRPWEQTLLAKREVFSTFPYVGHSGHDTYAVNRFRKHRKVVELEGEELFIYVGTPSSHTGRQHWEQMFATSTQLSEPVATHLKEVLELHQTRGRELVRKFSSEYRRSGATPH